MIEEIEKLIQEYVDTLKTLPIIPPKPKCPENASPKKRREAPRFSYGEVRRANCHLLSSIN